MKSWFIRMHKFGISYTTPAAYGHGESYSTPFMLTWIYEGNEADLGLLAKRLAYSKTVTRRTSEQLSFLDEIYRRAGEFELAKEVYKKIITDELHSALQMALAKIKQLLTDRNSQKVMLEDIIKE